MRILGVAGSLRRASYNRAHFGVEGNLEGNLTDPVLRTSLLELLEALPAWTLRIDIRRAEA